jgi:hypothetical protein
VPAPRRRSPGPCQRLQQGACAVGLDTELPRFGPTDRACLDLVPRQDAECLNEWRNDHRSITPRSVVFTPMVVHRRSEVRPAEARQNSWHRIAKVLSLTDRGTAVAGVVRQLRHSSPGETAFLTAPAECPAPAFGDLGSKGSQRIPVGWDCVVVEEAGDPRRARADRSGAMERNPRLWCSSRAAQNEF